MPEIRENSPAENAIFTLQISFEIEQWNLRNRLRTLHVTDGLFRALGVPRRFAACVEYFHSERLLREISMTIPRARTNQITGRRKRTSDAFSSSDSLCAQLVTSLSDSKAAYQNQH